MLGEGTVCLQDMLEHGSFLHCEPLLSAQSVLGEALSTKLGIWTLSRGHWRAMERFGLGKVVVRLPYRG